MNTESQNIEFKESWRDEYQKWICGFANAQGGILYVIPQVCQTERTYGGSRLDRRQSRFVGETPAL